MTRRLLMLFLLYVCFFTGLRPSLSKWKVYIAIRLQFLGLFQVLNFPCAKLSAHVENSTATVVAHDSAHVKLLIWKRALIV